MKYNRYTIHTTEEAEDLISAMLDELGVEGIEIEDKKPVAPEESGGLYGEVVPEMPEDDHLADISFYTDASEDPEEQMQTVRRALEELRAFADIGDGTVCFEEAADEDWLNNWKEFFHSFRIDDLLIEPTWESDAKEESEASMVLRIDPGTAFGTGKHETTMMVIRAIRKYIRSGMRFLDIGTGSGILSIVAIKSGAESAFGTDLDPNILSAVSDNMRQNGVSDAQFTRMIGDIVVDEEMQKAAGYDCYDIVAANILAEILVGITPAVPRHLKKGGIYITSGILSDREDIVIRAAEEAGMEVLEKEHLGEWSCLVFRLPA